MNGRRKNIRSDRSGCVGLVLSAIAGVTQIVAALTNLVLTVKGFLVAVASILVAWFALTRFGII